MVRRWRAYFNFIYDAQINMKYLNKNYFICIGSCISQLIYTIITDCDNPNLSICGEAYANRNKSKLNNFLYKGLNALFFFQKNHCMWAYQNDLEYAKWYIKRDKLSGGND